MLKPTFRAPYKALDSDILIIGHHWQLIQISQITIIQPARGPQAACWLSFIFKVGSTEHT
jgi:hypothetical protein